MSAEKSTSSKKSKFTREEISRLILFVRENNLYYDGKRIKMGDRQRLWTEISKELVKPGAYFQLISVLCCVFIKMFVIQVLRSKLN